MKHLHKHLAVLVICLSAVCRTAGQLTASRGDTILESFRAEIRRLNEILRLPGLCIAVVKNGKTVYTQTEGFANLEKKVPMTTDYMFQVASVTKTFTANLLMQYEQEHIARVDDYALSYPFIDIRFGWPYNVDVNTQLRHFLSHSSEDGPGSSFVYNGQRFNYIYGVFSKARGSHGEDDDFSPEIKKRIFEPLGMTNSLTGFPARRSDSLFSQIATPYIFDSAAGDFREDTVNYRWTKAFPATGILSTVGDLAKYTQSYDTHQLITVGSYEKLTTPTRLTDGSHTPYGMGWFTESFLGKKVHWHYGHADSYASLLIRIPETGYSFIFLSNSNAASEALRLHAGHIWQSPFAMAFFHYFIQQDAAPEPDLTQDINSLREQLSVLRPSSLSTVSEKLVGYASFYHYAGKTFGARGRKAQELLKLLWDINPARFDTYEPVLIYMLTGMQEPALRMATNRAIAAFERYNHIQPYVISDVASFYERVGDAARAAKYYRRLADAKGFETWQLTIDACVQYARWLFGTGKVKKGRTYFWRAINYMKMNYADDASIIALIDEMNRLTANKH